MSALTIVAKIVAEKACIDDVKVELLKMLAPTRKEEGCIEYRLHQDNEDPAVFVFYENWESPVFLEQHMNSPHFQQYVAAVKGMIVEKTVHKMTAIE